MEAIVSGNIDGISSRGIAQTFIQEYCATPHSATGVRIMSE